MTAEDLGEYDADIILVAPCGFDRKRATSDGEKMWRHAWWRELRAVKEGKVTPGGRHTEKQTQAEHERKRNRRYYYLTTVYVYMYAEDIGTYVHVALRAHAACKARPRTTAASACFVSGSCVTLLDLLQLLSLCIGQLHVI